MPSADSPSARPGTGPPDQELRQQWDGTTSSTLSVARHRGSSSVAQGRRLVRLGEARQQARPADCAGRAPADVGHVGEVTVELALVLVEQGQLPGAVARIDTALEQFGGEPVVVGEETADDMDERDYAGAGEGG